MNNIIKDIREDFAKKTRQQNKKKYAWEEKIEELYSRSDKVLQQGINYADSLIERDTDLDKRKISNLHTIAGEIYYDHDSIDKALKRFYLIETLTFDSPRNKANKAGCYVKKNNYEKAMTLLEEAVEINHDFKWYIGNLYEIMEEPEKAISEYKSIYQLDTVVYSYCNQRIIELKNKPNQLFTELYYKDRRKRILLLFEGVDQEANSNEIGGFRIEKNK